jgi:hypothetical protein
VTAESLDLFTVIYGEVGKKQYSGSLLCYAIFYCTPIFITESMEEVGNVADLKQDGGLRLRKGLGK